MTEGGLFHRLSDKAGVRVIHEIVVFDIKLLLNWEYTKHGSIDLSELAPESSLTLNFLLKSRLSFLA